MIPTSLPTYLLSMIGLPFLTLKSARRPPYAQHHPKPHTELIVKHMEHLNMIPIDTLNSGAQTLSTTLSQNEKFALWLRSGNIDIMEGENRALAGRSGV